MTHEIPKVLRHDDDGHKFMVPRDEVMGFDNALDLMRQFKVGSPEYYDACDYFNDRFWKYAFG